MLGATTASPLATARIAEQQVRGRRVLEQEAARAGAQRGVGVLVEVEGGEDDDPRRGSPEATIRRVASTPSMPGIRTSISTTSGARRATSSIACLPSAASPTTVEVRLRVEDHAKAHPQQLLIVDEHDARRHHRAPDLRLADRRSA